MRVITTQASPTGFLGAEPLRDRLRVMHDHDLLPDLLLIPTQWQFTDAHFRALRALYWSGTRSRDRRSLGGARVKTLDFLVEKGWAVVEKGQVAKAPQYLITRLGRKAFEIQYWHLWDKEQDRQRQVTLRRFPTSADEQEKIEARRKYQRDRLRLKRAVATDMKRYTMAQALADLAKGRT